MDTNTTRLYPTSIQDFAKLREGGHVYVDKTAHIHRLISGTLGAFFLSRPRRFGKSLLCSTLGAIFEGRRDLFQEIAGQPALAIDSLKWGWEAHPVIRLDLNIGDYNGGADVLNAVLQNELGNTAKRYGVELRGSLTPIQFANLIFDLHERFKERAVVIIDEYDKPLLETIDNPSAHATLRSALKGFYSVLKSYDAYLRFVFITGVTKFANVSIFSGLNQLKDLTLDPTYADLCGITQEELEREFVPEIEAVTDTTGISRETYMEKLRRFYNGYRFSKNPLTVYNPYGLLNHFDNHGEFLPYWYESSTPTFLIKLIKEQKIDIANLSGKRVDRESFGNYDVGDMQALPVLCLAGYLTISGYNEKRDRFTLAYPNVEVRTAFVRSLFKHYLRAPSERAEALIDTLPDALLEGDIDGAMEALRPFLSDRTHGVEDSESRKAYQSIIHEFFHVIDRFAGLDNQYASTHLYLNEQFEETTLGQTVIDEADNSLEAFANMAAAAIVNPDALNVMGRYLPRSVAMFTEIVKNLARAKK